MSTFSVDLSSNHTGHRRNQDQSQPVEETNCSDTDSTQSLVPDLEILITNKKGKGRFQKIIISMDPPPPIN